MKFLDTALVRVTGRQQKVSKTTLLDIKHIRTYLVNVRKAAKELRSK